MFFGESGKNEVRMRRRQEPALRLAAFGDALAPQRTRSDGDLGLVHLVAFPFRILARIEKAHQPRLLIVWRQKVSDREDYGKERDDGNSVLPAEPGQKN